MSCQFPVISLSKCSTFFSEDGLWCSYVHCQKYGIVYMNTLSSNGTQNHLMGFGFNMLQRMCHTRGAPRSGSGWIPLYHLILVASAICFQGVSDRLKIKLISSFPCWAWFVYRWIMSTSKRSNSSRVADHYSASSAHFFFLFCSRSSI